MPKAIFERCDTLKSKKQDEPIVLFFFQYGRGAAELLRKELPERGKLFGGGDFQEVESLLKLSADGCAAGTAATVHRQEITKRQEKLKQAEKQQSDREAIHQQELGKMQEKLDHAEKENKSLRSKLSAAISAIVGICKAIGMLDDYRGGKYSENSLSNRQSSLVSTLREIGSEIVAKLGFKQAAQDIDNTVSLPEQIEQRVENNLERRERRRGGMSR